MSLRGVRQLKELTIRYSDIDGSSKGIRNWMGNNLLNFAKENPTLLVRAVLRRSRHPFVRGHYLNGNTKTIGIKNETPGDINDYVYFLRNQIGRRVSFLFHVYFRLFV
jgi:large subunit ribosomal protein L43